MEQPDEVGAACTPSIRGDGVRRRRVLVVDDNEDIAVSSSRLLKLQGHEVAVAFDGLRALEVALEFRPDVALLDVGLPHVDGYELARRLRDEYGPEVLLIIVTAFASAMAIFVWTLGIDVHWPIFSK